MTRLATLITSQAEIVGIWPREEIDASYRLAPDALTALVVCAVFVSGLLILTYRPLMWRAAAAAAVALFSTLAYLALVQATAASLCVAAPLNVVAVGWARAAFEVSSRWQGVTFVYLALAGAEIVFARKADSTMAFWRRLGYAAALVTAPLCLAIASAYGATCLTGHR